MAAHSTNSSCRQSSAWGFPTGLLTSLAVCKHLEVFPGRYIAAQADTPSPSGFQPGCAFNMLSLCVCACGGVLCCAVQGEALDTKIDASLAKLYESRRRRDIYLGFAEDPVGFINTIIASQVSTAQETGFSGPVLASPAGQCRACKPRQACLCHACQSVRHSGLGWQPRRAQACCLLLAGWLSRASARSPAQAVGLASVHARPCCVTLFACGVVPLLRRHVSCVCHATTRRSTSSAAQTCSGRSGWTRRRCGTWGEKPSRRRCSRPRQGRALAVAECCSGVCQACCKLQ